MKSKLQGDHPSAPLFHAYCLAHHDGRQDIAPRFSPISPHGRCRAGVSELGELYFKEGYLQGGRGAAPSPN